MTFVATLALAGAVGAASGRRLEVSGQTMRIVWNEITFTSAFGETICALTLEGSFHSRTFSKVSGQLIGYITGATFGHPCAGAGEAFALNGVERPGGGGMAISTLPWHVRYGSFIGALPRITGMRIQIIGFSWLMEPTPGLTCLYKTTQTNPFLGTVELNAEGRVVRFRTEQTLPRFQGGILCPATITYSGDAAITPPGSSEPIVVRLVG